MQVAVEAVAVAAEATSVVGAAAGAVEAVAAAAAAAVAVACGSSRAAARARRRRSSETWLLWGCGRFGRLPNRGRGSLASACSGTVQGSSARPRDVWCCAVWCNNIGRSKQTTKRIPIDAGTRTVSASANAARTSVRYSNRRCAARTIACLLAQAEKSGNQAQRPQKASAAAWEQRATRPSRRVETAAKSYRWRTAALHAPQHNACGHCCTLNTTPRGSTIYVITAR